MRKIKYADWIPAKYEKGFFEHPVQLANTGCYSKDFCRDGYFLEFTTVLVESFISYREMQPEVSSYEHITEVKALIQTEDGSTILVGLEGFKFLNNDI